MNKKLIAALVLPLSLAACTNEGLVSVETPNVQGDMITLSENFAIGVGAGVDSRADYSVEEHDGLVRPYFTWDNTDEIGLGWMQGNDGLIYTNYQFSAFAYGHKELKAEMTPCAPVLWKNVAFFSAADATALGDPSSTTYVKTWNPVELNDPSWNLNNQTAFFRTANLTIFKGDYLIYYPFDATITEAGNLIAKSDASFTGVKAVEMMSEMTNAQKITKYEEAFEGVADNMFAVGKASIDGGTTAANFHLDPISGVVRVKISVDKDATKNWTINKVAIYSTEGIQLEQAVNASTKQLIADDVKETKVVFAELDANTTIVKAEDKYMLVALPALPQTIKNAYIGLFDESGNSVMVPVNDININSNKFTDVDVKLTDEYELQNEVFYVVDMETFALAMGNAGVSGAKNATIKLLNNIEYDQSYTNLGTGYVEVVNNMTIEGGDIIIPADQKLALHVHDVHADVVGKLTFNGKFIVEDKGCCGTNDAIVDIYGGETNTVTFSDEVINAGSLTIGKSLNPTNVTFEGNVTNNATLKIEAKANACFAKLVNNESVEMHKTTGAGQEVCVENLENVGEFIVGEYTKLTIEESLVNNGVLTIKTSKTGINGNDGTVDVLEEATVTNSATIANMGVYNNKGITLGKSGSEFIDYVGSQSISYNPLTIEAGAEYICEVNTSEKTEGDRLAYALNDNVPTTTVRFVEDGKPHEYQLGEYKSGYSKLATVKYIVNVAPTRNVIFKNNKSELTFGSELIVEKAKSVTFNGNKTKVNGNVTVNAGSITNNQLNKAQVVVAGNLTLNNATLNINALGTSTVANQTTAASWIVTKDVVLNEYSKMIVAKGAATDFNGNLSVAENAEATFKYSSYTDVNKKITVNGTFTRELSSGTDTANPAMVWCGSYDTKNGTIVNGGPQKR